MQPQFAARHISTKNAVAMVLSFAAGSVDAIGYIAIYKLFAANMTGNTVHLAQNSVQTNLAEAVKAAAVIAAFLFGSLIGRTIIEIGSRVKVRSIASATLLLEAALIAAVVPLGGSHPDRSGAVLGLFALLAAAMGIQTATLTRIGSLTVHTTFVTGMLNKLAQLLTEGLFLTYDLNRGRQVKKVRRHVFTEAGFIFSIWLLYLIGAGSGTWLQSAWGVRALLLPAGAICAVILVDQAAPLSLEEERDQPG